MRGLKPCLFQAPTFTVASHTGNVRVSPIGALFQKDFMLGLFRFTAFVFTIVVSVSAHAGFEDCPGFFVNGAAPKVSDASPAKRRELCFDAYAVLHSGQSKTAVYVVENLSKEQLFYAKGEVRTNRFYEEARLPGAERSRLEDYRAGPNQNSSETRFDRGHMAPAGDMPNAQAMAQSFSLSNTVPQARENNRGAWARGIEMATRKYVMRAEKNVYVFTGPVYAEPVETLGPNQVWIPKYLYKLIYDPVANKAWAHWLENADEARVGEPITYEELVRRTGIEFLSGAKPEGISGHPRRGLRDVLTTFLQGGAAKAAISKSKILLQK